MDILKQTYTNWQGWVCGVLVGMAVLVGLNLRLANYTDVPFPGESQDEYSYAWVGLSLLELGHPVGISGISGYELNDLRYVNVDRIFQGTADGDPMVINYPWFDHPPGLGLLTGGYAYVKGARVFEDTTVALVRKPMVYLGALNVLLVGVLGWLWYGRVAGVIGSWLYASMPIVVISSRMVQGENGWLSWWLLSLVCLKLFFDYKKMWLLGVAGFLAGGGMLFKLNAVVAVISGVWLLMSYYQGDWKRLRNALLVFLWVAGVVASSFVWYGLVVDGRMFGVILGSNAERNYGIGPEALFNLIRSGKITNTKYLTEAWLVAGWLAWAWSGGVKNIKQMDVGFVGVVSYLAVYVLMGSEPYGWYAVPFYPMLVLVIAKLVGDTFLNVRHFVVSGIVLMLPLGWGIRRLVGIEVFQDWVDWWRWGVLVGIGILVLGDIYNVRHFKYVRGVAVGVILGMLVVGIWLNVEFLNLVDLEYWYKIT